MAWIPTLAFGPVQLPDLQYDLVDRGQALRVYTSPSDPNRKAFITIIWDDNSVLAPEAHLSAIVSSDGGHTWSEVAGVGIFCQASATIDPGILSPTVSLCPEQLGENVYLLNSTTAGELSLFSFNLLTFSWATVRDNITAYDISNIDVTGPGPVPFILINDLGYAITTILNANFPDYSYFFFNVDGTAIGETLIVETDTDWWLATNTGISVGSQTLAPYFGQPGTYTMVGGTALDNSFTISMFETNTEFGTDQVRRRTIHFASDLSGFSLGVAVVSSPIPYIPPSNVTAKITLDQFNDINVTEMDLSSSSAPPLIDDNTGIGQTGTNQTAPLALTDADGTTMWVPWVGLIPPGTDWILVIGIAERNPSLGWNGPVALYSQSASDVSTLPGLGGGGFGVGTDGGDGVIDVMTLQVIDPPAGTWTIGPQWYWKILITTDNPPPLSISCPVDNTGTVGVPYTGQVIVTGGTPPYTWSIIS